MDKYSYLGNADSIAIEELYKNYLHNPDSVHTEWKQFFEGFEFARKSYEENGKIPENFEKEFKVIKLIDDYRARGHLFTTTNPVRERRKYHPTLDLENYGLQESDLNTVFQAGEEVGLGPTTLKDIISHLNDTYRKSIGVEYVYIRKPEVVTWIRKKLDESRNKAVFSEKEKRHILHKLNQAVVFEQFLHRKFVGQKRFSLEGGESLIPAIDSLVERGAALGVKEFIFGMAHRGRLNVLANIFNKTYEAIFSEFEGKEYEDNLFDGDVKYHLGYSADVKTDNGHDVHMTLAPNPSHLEAVDPVVEGITRAKIDHYLKDDNKIIPILIHGDAAIAGQGVVYEVIQMAKLEGYSTGGTIHIVVNNQVGFTTNYIDGRSSTYCTDVGKVTLSPVFHVNGDDVEAVVHAVQMAVEYRQKFHGDVFIDLLCYRKYGHNEGDEPRFTQPILYKAIAKHPNPREIYKKKLVEENVIKADEVEKMETDFSQMLNDRLDESKEIRKANVTRFLKYTWRNIEYAKEGDFDHSPDTGYNEKRLVEIAKAITTLPKDKKFISKIKKLINDRHEMVTKTKMLDWAMGELLAYATLLDEGYPVRISGQDVERGTFSHRHAVIKMEDSEEEYVPLMHIGEKQGEFYIYNSFLSEYGVLGFDYGYAMASPDSLVIWEAQFGDFNNGGQIIIDQFLSSAEEKWKSMNGLVMLLPHGYEGMGAEHSSGRMERYLILCAEDNMQVANCTTPANFYHLLRRQLHRPFRKPLIVFTPKSLLRHPKAVSNIKELTTGGFKEVLDDAEAKATEVEKLVFCSGKFYYDLLAAREERKDKKIAFIRIEQLYPFPTIQLKEILKKYKKAKKYVWAQEEPENMGAWIHVLRHFKEVQLSVVSLPASGSPATGSLKTHEKRHGAVIEQTFKI